MHTAQLNSGSFKHLIPIGEDGSPVWCNAAAFRHAVEREPKLGMEYAKFLAEPKFNENADHVDWYVPFPPVRADGEYLIVSWQSASPQEKSQALKKLSAFETKMQDFGYDLEARSLDSNSLLFAHYLTGRGHAENLPALHFPDENCLFIVDGQPVITFWGFVKNERSLFSSPFAMLRPQVLTPPHQTAGVAGSSGTTAHSHWWCWILLPLLLLLLLLLLWWLWQRFFAPDLPLFSVRPDLEHFSLQPVAQELTTSEEEQAQIRKVLAERYGHVVVTDPKLVTGGQAVSTDDQVLSPDAQSSTAETQAEAPLDGVQDNQAGTVPETESSLPAQENPEKSADGTVPELKEEPKEEPAAEQNATPPEAASEQPGQDNQAKQEQQAEADKNATPVPPELDPAQAKSAGEQSNSQPEQQSLKLNQSDLNSQNLKVLDGSWSSRSGLLDAKTGKPVNVQYAFKDGKGTATVTRADGTKCVTNINGSFKSGALNIDNEGLAKCADGSGYALPKVTCKPDKDGKTSCVGAYSDADQDKVNMQLFR